MNIPTPAEIRAALDWAMDQAAEVEDEGLAEVFQFLKIWTRPLEDAGEFPQAVAIWLADRTGGEVEEVTP